MKFIFYWNAVCIANFKKTLFSRRRSHMYSKFVDLNKLEKVIFIFNNIDPHVYEAFQLRETYFMEHKHGK